MSVKKAKKKTALIIAGTVLAFFVIPTLLVIYHNFVYAFVAITCSIACVAITIWGTWDELWPEIQARDKMIEDLYARCHTEKQLWYTKFYIDYFGL
jgi:hypothetical protein